MKFLSVGIFSLFGLGIAQSGIDPPINIWNKAAEMGILAALVLYFTYQSGVREKRMADALREREKFESTELSKIIAEQTAVIQSNTDVVKLNTEAMKSVIESIRRCPNSRSE